MAKPGRLAPEPIPDASLLALVDAERRFEERLAEARAAAAAEHVALEAELAEAERRVAVELASAEHELVERTADARDREIAHIRERSAARADALQRLEPEHVERLARRIVGRMLDSLDGARASP